MEEKKQITIEDIAQLANVSISTVSRVFNNSAPVRASTREAVLHAAAQLNYRPNVFAQSLASGQSMTIGVLTQHVSSPLYDSMMRGVLHGLEGTEYTPIFVDGYWDPKREQQAIETLFQRLVDGLIVLGGSLEEEILQQVAQQVPLVVFGRIVGGLENQCLYLDNFDGGYKATKHLIDLGHRRIAHITGILSHNDARDRRKGYIQALEDHDIDVDPELIIEGSFNEASGTMAVEMLLTRSRTFSAIFAANDQMAYGSHLALYRRGIRVPEDVSIVGFDDISHSAYTTPPLTTVRQPAEEIGARAAQTLLYLLHDADVETERIPAELIVRESTARSRV